MKTRQGKKQATGECSWWTCVAPQDAYHYLHHDAVVLMAPSAQVWLETYACKLVPIIIIYKNL